MRTIAWREENGGFIQLLDQRRLPESATQLDVTSNEELINAIQNLAVRGAPALGVAGALGVALIAHRAESESWSKDDIERAISQLREARPTAVNLAWGVDLAKGQFTNGPAAVLKLALKLAEDDAKSCREMGRIGADYLIEKLGKKKLRILTHCNTGALATTEWGTALGVVRELHSRKLIEEVFADETRPLLQGSRLTAWELAQAGIPYRILPDGAAASALFSGLIDAVLIGADRIARNGDSANKIGSLSVAVAASQVAVPFLVVAPESTVDRNIESGEHIEIEFRSDSEVTTFAGVNIAPAGSETYNPAFDVTPARYITAVVTDKKVYRVKDGEAL
ncbi:MAG: S-methyl-5-thioribose-1-phosphate isomerase [Actinomycetales bacterium]|nr:S-methyl-5-thioribose-1-phosphate isomerase [Actinomycetales bacterium]